MNYDDKMRARLDAMKERYHQINDQLMDTGFMSDAKKYAKLSKEQSLLEAPVTEYEKLLANDTAMEEAELLAEDKDPEIIAMAKGEIEELKAERQAILDRLEVLLIPKDPDDDCDAIMEIRGAVGGDEANIFAGDLFRMYSKYAESKGFRISVMDASESEAGGFALISFIVKGNGAYGQMKFESGSHRVQRVPKTESQGRVHTSVATVLCLPDVEDPDIEIDEKDLSIEKHHATGAGGQHINKTESAIRIVHIPTGITVNCQEGRSQMENRETAMRTIKARVYDYYKKKQEEEKHEKTHSLIGSGMRAEKIRTYNYPQNRVTDHRIGWTVNQLDRIIEGKMDDLIAALQEADQKAKIAGEDA
ncbi:MAG: peptide chain release factor 1 [Erysipelotrichales bacterium]|nr:peptide chain release factor 1 [Erysipelotrichales bacterium]